MRQLKKKQVKEYFEYLQENLTDVRDLRGKKHNLAFVMTGFLIGLLRGHNKPASIVRYLKKEHKWLQKQADFYSSKSISDPQFRRLVGRLRTIQSSE